VNPSTLQGEYRAIATYFKKKGGEKMRNKICGIYMVTNTINGDCYIGQSKDIQRRWWMHKGSRTNIKKLPIVGKAIKEFGINNFKLEILEECSRSELNEKEIYWIEALSSRENGNYNILRGGQDRMRFDDKPVELYDL
jgi:group I intron endonuclease